MHLRNVCISDKCPSNPRWRRCALILICCEFIFRLDANLPWNELFILRCFPVESVLAYGELHVEKLLYHIVPVVPVPFIHRWLVFGLCKISDVARSFRVYNVFHVSFFSFFSSGNRSCRCTMKTRLLLAIRDERFGVFLKGEI